MGVSGKVADKSFCGAGGLAAGASVRLGDPSPCGWVLTEAAFSASVRAGAGHVPDLRNNCSRRNNTDEWIHRPWENPFLPQLTLHSTTRTSTRIDLPHPWRWSAQAKLCACRYCFWDCCVGVGIAAWVKATRTFSTTRVYITTGRHRTRQLSRPKPAGRALRPARREREDALLRLLGVFS